MLKVFKLRFLSFFDTAHVTQKIIKFFVLEVSLTFVVMSKECPKLSRK